MEKGNFMINAIISLAHWLSSENFSVECNTHDNHKSFLKATNSRHRYASDMNVI